MRLATIALIVVLVIAGIVVAYGVSHGHTPAAVSPSTTSLPANPAAHDACDDLPQKQVTDAIGLSPALVHVLRSADAIDATWQRTQAWSGCSWNGVDKQTRHGGGVQLAVARFPKRAAAAAFFALETRPQRPPAPTWHEVAGLGAKARYLDEHYGLPTGEIVVLRGTVTFGIEYVILQPGKGQQQLKAMLKEMARQVLTSVFHG